MENTSEFMEYAEAAWRGARLMDLFDPGWVVYVDYGQLDQMECEACVLGQSATWEEPYFARLTSALCYAWDHNIGDVQDRWETFSSMPTDWFSQFFGFDLLPDPRSTLTARFELLTAYWRWELDARRLYPGKRPAYPYDLKPDQEMEDMP